MNFLTFLESAERVGVGPWAFRQLLCSEGHVWYFVSGRKCAPILDRGFFYLGLFLRCALVRARHAVPVFGRHRTSATHLRDLRFCQDSGTIGLRVGIVFVEVPHRGVLSNVARYIGEFFTIPQDALEIIAWWREG